ncbi:MAG: DUF1569 domain-containing protein [Bacteroidota bacterium]|nr:DUF1569 domain-containing protein [Bacteroidota bacterium]
MKTLFNPDSLLEIQLRIQKLTPDKVPLWGQMEVAQMLAHCSNPLESAMGKVIFRSEENALKILILRIFFKKMNYSPAPFKKNLPTVPSFKVVEQKQFEKEKLRLLQNVSDAFEKGLDSSWSSHPSFGYFTPEQWGLVHYKHLNHHLTQFGV